MRLFAKSLIAASIAAASMGALAMGGGSGPATNYIMQGHIGEVMMNPYGIAPLTAVIRDGGYDLSNVVVKIQPKLNGQTIEYKVSRTELLTHGGVPVFGLYPDYNNTVEVSYTIVDGTKETRVENEVYRIYTPGIHTETNGTAAQHHAMFETEVKKVAPEFKDRLYFINNFLPSGGNVARTTWNNPMGGALEWVYYPQNAVIDTAGDVRWYMFVSPIYDPENIYKSGIMMGFHQADDGFLTFGYGQRYAKYDLMGREVFNRRLPVGYADFSHAMDPMQNGNYLVRVASSDHVRPDGKHVHTVRDVIIEVDASGEVVDEWRLFEILDPNRNIVLKSIDQGAVCLNIDTSQSGKTLSAEQLAKLEAQHAFGDIAGTGAGRNWAHVNSVDHDPVDDSIILSSRHQSAVVKIGRDKQVKWILAAPNGWRDGLKDKVLTPVGKDGRPLSCRIGKCEGGFDWTWTQHTGWRIDAKSNKDIFYLSVFDNGDARGMEQPALPEMKYSRAVVYKIDQKKMTVEQVWEYGKERGFEWYSPITSVTEYQADKNSVFVYSATASLNMKQFKSVSPNPVINEFKWGSTEPSVEIVLKSTMGYRALPISLDKAFSR